MKAMTCKQLGGACDMVFEADTWEEMAHKSKTHSREMFQQKDAPHLEAMQKMQSLMETPEAMQKWFAERKAEFDALPER